MFSVDLVRAQFYVLIQLKHKFGRACTVKQRGQQCPASVVQLSSGWQRGKQYPAAAYLRGGPRRITIPSGSLAMSGAGPMAMSGAVINTHMYKAGATNAPAALVPRRRSWCRRGPTGWCYSG